MQTRTPEYTTFSHLWESQNRIPTASEYRTEAPYFRAPSLSELKSQYGSYETALWVFIDAYHAIHGYAVIPDYLLGALVTRASIVIEPSHRQHLRFITKDMSEILVLRSFMEHSTFYKASSKQSTQNLRCYDGRLIAAFKHLCSKTVPFRSTVDFVRGYIETHSHFRKTNGDQFRLTLTGALVPQVHDFLVGLGARDTSVYSVKESPRMNIHTNSLRRIRDTLYPVGCICNNETKHRIYKA